MCFVAWGLFGRRVRVWGDLLRRAVQVLEELAEFTANGGAWDSGGVAPAGFRH
jgi:hypothetical protein